MGIKSKLQSEFDYGIVDEFLDHYSLMTELIEPLVVGLTSERTFHKNLDELFKIFHNIKSATEYLQIESIGRLSLFVEDFLGQLKMKGKILNDDTTAWMIKISDMFARWNDDFENDSELSKIPFELLVLPDLEKY